MGGGGGGGGSLGTIKITWELLHSEMLWSVAKILRRELTKGKYLLYEAKPDGVVLVAGELRRWK